MRSLPHSLINLELNLSMMTDLINIANHCQSTTISGQDLATLGKYSHIIRESTLYYLRFVDWIPGMLSQGYAMELWEPLRILEVFHTSSVLLWEKLSDEKCKPALSYLEIIAAASISVFDFHRIEKNYKLSIRKRKVVDDVLVGSNPTLPDDGAIRRSDAQLRLIGAWDHSKMVQHYSSKIARQGA